MLLLWGKLWGCIAMKTQSCQSWCRGCMSPLVLVLLPVDWCLFLLCTSYEHRVMSCNVCKGVCMFSCVVYMQLCASLVPKPNFRAKHQISAEPRAAPVCNKACFEYTSLPEVLTIQVLSWMPKNVTLRSLEDKLWQGFKDWEHKHWDLNALFIEMCTFACPWWLNTLPDFLLRV